MVLEPHRLDACVAGTADIDAPVVAHIDGFFGRKVHGVEALFERHGVGFGWYAVLTGNDNDLEKPFQFGKKGDAVGARVLLPLGVGDESQPVLLVQLFHDIEGFREGDCERLDLLPVVGFPFLKPWPQACPWWPPMSVVIQSL